MTKKTYLIMALCMTAILSMATPGCGGSGGGKDIADLARKLPGHTSDLHYYDLQQLRGQDGLSEFYDDLVQWFGYSDLGDAIVFEFSDITWWAEAYGSEGTIEICAGVFSMQEVRTELSEEGYNEDTYEGVELFDNGSNTIAIAGDQLIAGNREAVEDCIDAINGEAGSFYDEPDAAAVVSRLSSGITYSVEKVSERSDTLGLVITGASMAMKDKDTLNTHVVGFFENADYAAESLAELEKEITSQYGNSSIRQDGRVIEIRGETDVDDFYS